MKAINYKMKKLNSFLFHPFPKEALGTSNYPEYISRLQKERQI